MGKHISRLHLLHEVMPPATFQCQAKNRATLQIKEQRCLLLHFLCMKDLSQQYKHIINSAATATLVMCQSFSVSLRRKTSSFHLSPQLLFLSQVHYNLNFKIHFASFSSRHILLDLGKKQKQANKFSYLYNFFQTIFLWKIDTFHMHIDFLQNMSLQLASLASLF